MSRPTYTATATRADRGWTVDVSAGAGRRGRTQVTRYVDIEPQARELLSVLTDARHDTFDVAVRIDVPSAELVDQVARLRAAWQAAQATATEATVQAARTLYREGVPAADVAAMLGVSHQYVAKIVRQAVAA